MFKLFRLLVLMGVLAAFLGSCKNACKDTVCLNGGDCSNGRCDCTFQYGGQYCDSLCPIGYEGTFCTTEIRTKFLRNWNATTTSSTGQTIKHNVTLTAGSAISYINIYNYNNEGFNVIGIVSGKNAFAIYQQNATGAFTGVVSGSGTLTDSRLSIYLTKQNGPNYFANCNP